MEVTVQSELLRAEAVRLVVAFGSRARGAGRPSSDLDIGILFEPFTDDLHSRAERARDALASSHAIDVALLDTADPLLLHEAAVDGIPLFEAHPGAFEEFRILAVKRYWDTAWLRRMEAEALRERYL